MHRRRAQNRDDSVTGTNITRYFTIVNNTLRRHRLFRHRRRHLRYDARDNRVTVRDIPRPCR